MLKYLLYLYITGICVDVLAQDSVCVNLIKPFNKGELVYYRAYYNWRFIWLNAGDVLFTVKDTVYKNQPAYHFISRGWSLKEYDWFFKVRDRFEAIVSKDSFKPLWFLRDTYEGGFKTYNRYEFDYQSNQVKIISYTSNRPYREDVKELRPCTYDVLSAIYRCRAIDFNQYNPGVTIPLSMLVDNDFFNLFIRYHGRENLKLRDGSSHKTIKFSVMLVEGTIFKGGEDMTIWVSDDENRVPIMVEAKILVGSVKAIIDNNRHINGNSDFLW